MGQYYKGILLDKNKENVIGWVSSYKYSNGAKLMEHSWVDSDFVKSFENLICNNPMPVVWGGDYADGEPGVFMIYDNEEHLVNLYSMCEDITELNPSKTLDNKKSRYVINHDTKEFIDKKMITKNSYGWQIHPLPLLTAEGNGRGGGDYMGEDTNNIIGSWARCSISVSEKLPKEYKELNFNLMEL